MDVELRAAACVVSMTRSGCAIKPRPQTQPVHAIVESSSSLQHAHTSLCAFSPCFPLVPPRASLSLLLLSRFTLCRVISLSPSERRKVCSAPPPVQAWALIGRPRWDLFLSSSVVKTSAYVTTSFKMSYDADVCGPHFYSKTQGEGGGIFPPLSFSLSHAHTHTL